MRRLLKSTAAARARRNFVSLPLLCALMILSAQLCASAQEAPKSVTLTSRTTFKVKLTRDLSSGKIRVGDYIPFVVAEDVMITPGDSEDGVVVIKKDTPAFGQVLDRRNRFTILRKGAFGVGNLETKTVDGGIVRLVIRRGKLPRDEEKTLAERQKETLCVDKTKKKAERASLTPCVRGRTYAGSFVSNLPTALLAVATATVLVRVKDDATGAVVGVTLADKLVSQPGLSNIINGVDAEMGNGEVFDAEVIDDSQVKLPKPKAPAP